MGADKCLSVGLTVCSKFDTFQKRFKRTEWAGSFLWLSCIHNFTRVGFTGQQRLVVVKVTSLLKNPCEPFNPAGKVGIVGAQVQPAKWRFWKTSWPEWRWNCQICCLMWLHWHLLNHRFALLKRPAVRHLTSKQKRLTLFGVKDDWRGLTCSHFLCWQN